MTLDEARDHLKALEREERLNAPVSITLTLEPNILRALQGPQPFCEYEPGSPEWASDREGCVRYEVSRILAFVLAPSCGADTAERFMLDQDPILDPEDNTFGDVDEYLPWPTLIRIGVRRAKWQATWLAKWPVRQWWQWRYRQYRRHFLPV